MEIRIWFNHWFSSAYFLINLIRNYDSCRYYVLGSNENEHSVVKLACDEWYREDKRGSDDAYVQYCLRFCEEHNVDVFVPKRGLQSVCRSAQAFADIGTKLFVPDDNGLVEALSDKSQTYQLVRNICPECVPPYEVVDSAEKFGPALARMAAITDRICMKRVVDEGALSFRVIYDETPENRARYQNLRTYLSYEEAQQLIAGDDFDPPLMLMPYLLSPEVSVDCLATAQGVIAIPRFKLGGRMEEIRFDAGITGFCERILRGLSLTMPCNLQFRFLNERPYLLEINTRMSGGLQLSCLASGVNIPGIAMNQLYGIEKAWRITPAGRRVSYVEMPVILE